MTAYHVDQVGSLLRPQALLYLRDVEGNPIELFVDSDWYIAQPCAEPLDLSESDAEVREATEAFCRQQPGFQPYAEWRAEIAEKMRLQQGVAA